MSQITDMLKAAVAARKDSLTALRGRIVDLLEPLPIGVVLADAQGEVLKVVRIYTGASQWSNRKWEVTIKGVGYLHNGQLVAVDCQDSHHDGNNLHTRTDEPYLLDELDYGEPGASLRWLNGKETRALALRLPAAIERYMDICKAEIEANNATLLP